ncbi:MAG: hypothetical protein K5851_03830 [Lachnospiraceae bacterium]|nr:hypothetical protein [Lachnospiraceae bacterium]
MASYVTIKSNASCIILKLDRKAPIEDVLREICHKFAASRKFFGKSNIVLQIEDRRLSDDELNAVIQSVEYNSDLKVSLIRIDDKTRGKKYLEMMRSDKQDYIDSNFRIVYGPIEDKTIESDISLIILGDVPEYTTINCAGNIVVFGELEGRANAGNPERNHCFVVANNITADKLSIGAHECDIPKKRKKLFSGKNNGSVIIFEKDRFIMNDFGNIDLYKHINKRKARR